MGEREAISQRRRVVNGQSGRGDGAIVVIDESIATLQSGEIYIVAAAVVAPAAERSAVSLSATTALRAGSATRRRPFHWTDEGPAVRSAVVDALTHRAVSVVSSHRELTSTRDYEHSRTRLMGSLIEATCEFHNVELVLFESREKELGAVGQNRSDHEVITTARHAGVLPYSAHYANWGGVSHSSRLRMERAGVQDSDQARSSFEYVDRT